MTTTRTRVPSTVKPLLTTFGRRERLFNYLDNNLRLDGETAKGLVVGGGLYYSEASIAAPELFGFEQDELFSWEYLEMYALLKRKVKNPEVVVVDKSQKVCTAVKNQKRVFVPLRNEYHDGVTYYKNFISAFKHEVVSEEKLKILNERLSADFLANYNLDKYHIYAAAIVYPPENGIEVVNSNIINYCPGPIFDAFSVGEVLRYAKDSKRAIKNLWRSLKIGGVGFIFDSKLKFPWFKNTRNFKGIWPGNDNLNIALHKTTPDDSVTFPDELLSALYRCGNTSAYYGSTYGNWCR